MKASITRVALLALGLCGARLTSAQTTYTPVVVTGFTNDIVANGSGRANTSTTNPADQGVAGNRFAYVAPTFVSPLSGTPVNSLPATGLITSVQTQTPGLRFQLASYSANNSLRLAGSSSGFLALATPQSAQTVWVAGASGNGQTVGTPV